KPAVAFVDFAAPEKISEDEESGKAGGQSKTPAANGSLKTDKHKENHTSTVRFTLPGDVSDGDADDCEQQQQESAEGTRLPETEEKAEPLNPNASPNETPDSSEVSVLSSEDAARTSADNEPTDGRISISRNLRSDSAIFDATTDEHIPVRRKYGSISF
ncbi:unnamed protein product, partial [Gongylonema pulchrum]|uniref:RRM domain-containing protein n=1 Tax=Gongylonema pulchrum TaxID=637853 RepID=A0A183D7D5_9BILA